MTRTLTGLEWKLFEWLLMKDGSILDRTWIKIGTVGVARVWISDRPHNEGESKGWVSEICTSRDVGSFEEVVK